MLKELLIVSACLLLSGCATISQATSQNRDNLLKLSIGMPKEKALEIMGHKTRTAYYNPSTIAYANRPYKEVTITNPYRSEILQGKGRTLEVVYYVTDVKKDDGAITDDELTPLVFDKGSLAGWGWGFLEDTTQKYQITIR